MKVSLLSFIRAVPGGYLWSQLHTHGMADKYLRQQQKLK